MFVRPMPCTNDMTSVISPLPIKACLAISFEYPLSCSEPSNEEAAHAELFSIMAQHNYSYQRNNCMTSPVSRTINPMPNDTLFCTVHAATIATVRAVTAAHRGQDCVAPERGFVLPADTCVPMGKTRSYSTNSGEMATRLLCSILFSLISPQYIDSYHVLDGMLAAAWKTYWRAILDDVAFVPTNLVASVNT
ncbi:hypothetical protein PHYBLDRAFT_143535 [Phycomyces blakesleeanus NRRL 1555(-)]|uniref:Uncharacterized protein n=1 Tax=Phycomyces blakesleeanus (strain ATCC 8743b / DSM 1359 / FGSC 10004 / NBRC 33097 / NRRL 1555) TaxID=763407 RepID=A0A162PRB8_PHYB8|nr:hypothetical protein PHYBLDRAFT_143535 [Phycomyces blakesleeanus NRRL 1555(-)]OAD75277.1 hypothetical protein PHYBLDRAFT_143535 [Phycomyces blakesleeanus NRRL 1555(-)]|eukprot:XP_018293317.1 hypothetical protein PHYBLDRAFT_143535 [Phycomyces blakesleeanus NRRL 1555(-)]